MKTLCSRNAFTLGIILWLIAALFIFLGFKTESWLAEAGALLGLFGLLFVAYGGVRRAWELSGTVAILFLLLLFTARAQDTVVVKNTTMKIEKLTVGSGDGPVMSGLDFSLRFRDSVEALFIQGNGQREYLMYGRSYLGDRLRLQLAAGFFWGTPMVAPRIDFLLTDWFSLVLWQGWKAGNYYLPNWDATFHFSYGACFFTTNGVTAGYAVQNFLGAWAHMPEVDYEFVVDNVIIRPCWAVELIKDQRGRSLFRIEVDKKF